MCHGNRGPRIEELFRIIIIGSEDLSVLIGALKSSKQRTTTAEGCQQLGTSPGRQVEVRERDWGTPHMTFDEEMAVFMEAGSQTGMVIQTGKAGLSDTAGSVV